METSGVVYEGDYNNCLKKYAGETGRKLKERMKEHKKTTEHMKTTGHSPSWDDVRTIYRESNWKKRKFKEAARIAPHNKEQLMN